MARDATVLVTGASGFLGSHLVERLLALKFRVLCLVRPTSSLGYLPASSIELIYGDLVTGEGIERAVKDVQIVFHVGGITKASRAADYYSGNVRSTQNLLQACAQSGVERFVHISSLAAVGPSQDGMPLAEDACPRPVSHYGRSKLQAEEAVRRSPLATRAVIVRPPVIYGPRDAAVFQIFRAAARGLFFQIGGETSCFSIVYVKNLVEGLLLAGCSRLAPGKTYFLANEHPVSWNQFSGTLAEVMGRKLRSIRVPATLVGLAGICAEAGAYLSGRPAILSRDKIKEIRGRYWTCSTAQARQELGFAAETSLREGMTETLAWYRQTGWLKP